MMTIFSQIFTRRGTHPTLILAIFVLFVLPNPAQIAKPQAKKFDEINQTDELKYPAFVRYDESEKEINRRVARYNRQLLLEKAQPFIVLYKSRIRSNNWSSKPLAERLGDIGYRLGFDKFEVKNLEVIDGGFREQSVLELWIVPPGAEKPPLTPTAKPDEIVYCPHVYASQTLSIPPANQPLEIKATVWQDKESKITPKFKWEVIGGKIIKGEGEDSIFVQPDSASGTIKAKVSVEGFSSECSCTETSGATEIPYGKSHYKVDEFGNVQSGDLKARLDQFAVLLQNDPAVSAYIITYGARSDAKGLAVARRKVLITTYLTRNRGIDSSRLIFVKDLYRENLTTELWIVLANGEPPPVTPSVDKKYIKVR